MMPFPPARLSTMMFCPSWISICRASVLAITSGLPPGGIGRTSRIGRLGYACPQALLPEINAIDASARTIKERMVHILPKAHLTTQDAVTTVFAGIIQQNKNAGTGGCSFRAAGFYWS